MHCCIFVASIQAHLCLASWFSPSLIFGRKKVIYRASNIPWLRHWFQGSVRSAFLFHLCLSPQFCNITLQPTTPFLCDAQTIMITWTLFSAVSALVCRFVVHPSKFYCRVSLTTCCAQFTVIHDNCMISASLSLNGSCSLLDYITTDNGLRGKYYYVFDSPIKSNHLAQILFTDFTLTQKQKPLRKWISDKRNYDPLKFRNSLNYINWSLIYESNDIEAMFSRFESLIADVIRLHAPIRKIFIRNHKPNFSLVDKFVSNTTKKPQ